ncbi:hypothetical protein SARC_15251 [Sphaeroforma arctica JP610]|uniref:SH2 domain-containing protein n=1 Tax=Sphaeroforma arctica JP610 TaxID=667725 RepID=A0A0L0F6D8_9EUKA|nr:hypothetical protein SARC_15251 [Sphaeroforma arctica JP610]KNC72199.1 hypothetical protein SARC_15251 [Sphaeroforma arctica JP610]|eukprot:XP_014146101.1 hypothetical protein SARC_15251 [Sphaeroforma arctica JP610]
MRRQHTIPSDATADISGAMGSVDVPYDTLHAMPSDLRRGSSRVDTESSAGVTATSGYEDMDTIEDVIVSFNAQYGLDGAVEKTQTKEAGIHHIHNRIPELARAGESHSPRYMRAASLDKEGALIKPVQSGTLAPNNQPTPARDTIPIAKPRPAPRPLRKHVTQGAVETKPGAHLHVASPDSPKHRRNSSARPRGGSGNPISPVGGRRLPDLPLARACSNDPHTHIDAHSHISVSSSLHQSVGIASLKSRGRPTPVLPKATSADISRIGNTECRTYIDGETIEHSTCFQYFDTTLSRSHKRRVMDTLMKPEDTGAWFIRHDTSGCRYILVIK